MSTSLETWTIRRLLEWTQPFFERKDVDPARLSAEQLLAHVLRVPRIKLYTDYDKIVDPTALTRFRDLVRRAGEQEPIAYLTGTAHFFNLEFTVTRDVLIPRPDTETIVEHALQWLRNTPPISNSNQPPRILDLCTGTACIAAAIAHHNKNCQLVATDISPAAIAVAKSNIDRLSLNERVDLLTGDLFTPLSGLIDHRPFDMLVCNPPYIPTSQIAALDRSVRDYEPPLALDGGLDGLEFHRRILTDLPKHLSEGARIYIEIAFDQGPAALELAQQHKYLRAPTLLRDQAGRNRVLSATFNVKP